VPNGAAAGEAGVESALPAADAGNLAAERLARLRHRQFETIARQAARLPVPVMLAAGAVGLTVWDSIYGPLVLGWMTAIALVLTARWQYSHRAGERTDLDVGRALGAMAALSFCNGLVTGSGALLFFPDLALERKALVTMVFVCGAAGAAAANAGYARAFYAYTVPLMGALAAGWTLQGDVAGAWNAVLVVLFAAILAVFVRESERTLRESYEIRHKHERLLRELDRERQAVIRERDRAEEANRAKSRFLAAASHDLRQPLHTVSLFSAALALHKADERTRELGREIGNAIRSLGSLLDALLDISKLDADAVRPEPSRFTLGSFLAPIAAELRPVALEKGLTLELDAAEPVPVQTDEILLGRIVRNLVDNAIKYTAAGGVRLEARQVGTRAVLTVSDTGPGIPREEHERVFEEFYQLSNPERDRSRGIGLGLAIVRRLTKLLGIELVLDSDAGRGTRFVLSLPVAAARGALADARSLAPERDEAALPSGMRVLVIDDEVSVREGMRSLLESWGLSVTLASGIEEALSALDGRQTDLIIADHRLRGRETGIELVRRARRLAGEIPALLITGDTGARLLDEARELGLKLLHKPVSERALRGAIAQALLEGAH
jgi:signal transduction histidine kinase/CheY-like chemotaxis protein